MKNKFILFLTVILILAGCDEQGLNPNDPAVTASGETGFSGTITYVSRIPSDSLHGLRVIAVPYYPVDTTFGDVFIKVVNGVIAFGDDITSTADSGRTAEYKMIVNPQTYYYVAVVQQFGLNGFQDWRVVSVYGNSPAAIPDSVVVRNGEISLNINFVIDFYNLPPQPF